MENSLSLTEAFFNMQLVAKLSSSNTKFLLEDRSTMDSGRKKNVSLWYFAKVLEEVLQESQAPGLSSLFL